MRNWLTSSVLKVAILLASAAPFLEAGTNPATITVTPTPNPWTDQTQPLSVQVTVTGGVGTATGSIKAYIDNAGVGSVIPLSGGSVTFTIPSSTYNIPSPNLQQGTHTIGVAYSGDSNYLAQGANNNAAQITVAGQSSTTLIASSSQLVMGQTVVLTATVSIGATGTVSFIDNGFQTIATANVVGNQAVTSPLTLAQGIHPIVAQYNGDSNFGQSSSNVVDVTVGKANTTTLLTSPPNGSAATAGTPVTLNAQVAVQAPGSATLSGSVQFLDTTSTGTKVLATQTLSGGTASFVATLPAGSHSLTATYAGNSNLNASTSSPVAFTVNGLATTTNTPTVTGNAAVGQNVTITTTVMGPTGSAVPTGAVTFLDGTVSIGTIILDSTGKAVLNVTFQSPGTHFIFANYAGDNTFAPSGSSVFALSICPSNANVTVTSSVTAPVYGQTVIFTGTVSPAAPGSMDFLADGQSMLSGLPITLVNGQAQFGPSSSSPLSSGAHDISVTYYCGTGTTGISSKTLSLIVNSDNSTTTLTASLANPMQLTATVLPSAPGFGVPTGSVQFMSGTTQLGTPVLLDSSSGIALATYTATNPGTITAVYSGDANFFGSTSGPVTVATVPATITLTSSENPAALGDNITFTATVTGGSIGGTPAGTVSFFDGTTSLASAVALSPTGQAQCSTNTLTAGSHTISAQYNPSGAFQPVQATIGEYVAQGGGGGGFGPGSTIAATATPQPAVYGQAVTLTATVTPTGTGTPPTPTGQVTFQTGTNVLGTAPVGQGLAVSSLSPGTYNVTAAYSGDSVYPAAQTTVSFVVAQASTQTVYSPKTNQSGQATLTATVTVVAPGAGTPTGTVQFEDASQNNLTITTATLAGGTASAIVDASIATHIIVAVYNGDTNFSGSTSAAQLQLVSTAANITSSFAPDEAVSAYHVTNLTGDTPAGAFPLPTSLAGATVKITDSAGISWLAPLYGVFASASQINFVVPSTVALGPATFTVLLPGNNSMSAVGNITLTSPAIFTANQNGQGVATGQFVTVTQPGNVQTFQNVAVYDTTQNKYVPNPVNLGSATDQVYLILYGTGIRHRASDADVSATVNGVSVPILSAAQPQYPGLDQMNLQLPNSLAGAGTVNVIVVVNGQTANTVQIAIQ